MSQKTQLAGSILSVAWLLVAGCGTGSEGPGRVFDYRNEVDSVRVAYSPGPPAQVFDSSLVGVAVLPGGELGTDSLFFDLLPAEGGWSLAVDPYLVRDSTGWYRGAVWMRPTERGQYVLRWQTVPFTGFTFYLSAWYDMAGRLARWDQEPKRIPGTVPLLVRDTMEIVFQRWPHVWYRRVHLVHRGDMTYWVITQSLQRSAGVSGRRLRYTANLTFDPQYPLRTRVWDEAGWVTDTVLVRLRDTLVAWLVWDYEEFVENWEKGYSLFRDWQHVKTPEFYFQADPQGHLVGVWRNKPEGKYIAAKMYADTSRPDFDSLKRDFIRNPRD
jgi:hypothetical protein